LECSAVGGRWCALWIVVDVVQWVGGGVHCGLWLMWCSGWEVVCIVDCG